VGPQPSIVGQGQPLGQTLRCFRGCFAVKRHHGGEDPWPALIVGVVAGLYPSFYLSAFKPVSVLKGDVSRGSKNSILRNSLVVFQFTTSIILIIGTFIIYKQMDYIRNSKLGYDKDQVLVLQSTHTLGDQVISFKNEVLKLSQVKSVSISDYLPVSGTKRNGNSMYNEGKTKEEVGISSQVWVVDHDYLKTMGIKLPAATARTVNRCKS
jgi:putative ABC transport system permease protein